MGLGRRWLLGLWLSVLACGGWALPAKAVTPVNNRDYGEAVRELLAGARKSVVIMLYQARFYEEYPDTLTNAFVVDLIAARQRGVDVKLLIDTGRWNPTQKNEYLTDFANRLTTSCVEIWEDSPEEVSHEKVMCVDDEITLVASANWTFYSIAKNNEVGVVISSPEVNAWFRGYFEARRSHGKRWPAAGGCAVSASATTGSAGLKELPGKRVYGVSEVVPCANRDFYPVVHDALLSATKSIDVVQKSLLMVPGTRRSGLPGEPASQTNVLIEDLVSAARRGVHVRVIVDQGENEDEGNSEAALYLRARGVEVLGDDPETQTHAKLLVIDDDKTILGSTNWTQAAIEDGNEASVLVVSRELNQVYHGYVETLARAAAPYRLPSKSIWK